VSGYWGDIIIILVAKKTSNSILTFEIELLVLDIAKKLYCFLLNEKE